MFSTVCLAFRRAAFFTSVAFALCGCASAELILEHEEAHTIQFDWHRPGAKDREPPLELRAAALPAGTIVRAYPGEQLALWCLKVESIACTARAESGWVIRMLDVDVMALVASGRLAKTDEPNTYIDAKRSLLR